MRARKSPPFREGSGGLRERRRLERRAGHLTLAKCFLGSLSNSALHFSQQKATVTLASAAFSALAGFLLIGHSLLAGFSVLPTCFLRASSWSLASPSNLAWHLAQQSPMLAETSEDWAASTALPDIGHLVLTASAEAKLVSAKQAAMAAKKDFM